jgi:hypothetical protein
MHLELSLHSIDHYQTHSVIVKKSVRKHFDHLQKGIHRDLIQKFAITVMVIVIVIEIDVYFVKHFHFIIGRYLRQCYLEVPHLSFNLNCVLHLEMKVLLQVMSTLAFV